MDPHQRWLADFKKEIDEVLDMLRTSKANPANLEAAATAKGLPGQFEGLKTARVEYARLEFLVEDLQRKLASRTLQFESEQKTRDRLKGQVHDLSDQVRALEEKAAAFRREAVVHSEEAKELDETLRVTMQARSQLVSALDDEKRQMEAWMSESKALKSKLDGMDHMVGQKEAALHEAQARYEEACKTFASETGELHKETARLSAELEKARAGEIETQARMEAAKRAMEAEQSQASEEAQALRRQGVAELEEARKLKAEVESERDRNHQDVRAEKERNEAFRSEAEAVMKKALGMEKELLKRNEEDLAAEKAKLDLERSELLSELEDERARMKKQAIEEIEVQRAVNRLHAEQGLRREAIMKGADAHSPRLPEAASGPAAPSPSGPQAPSPAAAAPAPGAPCAEGAGAEGAGSGLRGWLGRWWPAAAGCAVLACAGAVALLWKGPVVQHPVPFSHPTALVWKRGELWASDWYESAVYRMKLDDGKLSVLARYKLPGSHITGMAVAEGAVYLADSWKKEIAFFKVQDDKLVLEKAWPSPGPNPSALFLDGPYLYSADGSGLRVYKHAADEGLSVLQSWKVGFAPVAVLPSAEYFWTAEADSRRLYSHRHDAALGVDSGWSLSELESGREPLSCMARSGRGFWFGRDGSKVLLEAPQSRLKAQAPRN
ncbi:MAG: hypothetical protein HY748_10740 [Elusimicrobia bacterium]|nr:hypothetical protein [Elusimicrobiota bacterium]